MLECHFRFNIFFKVLDKTECKEEGIEIPLEEHMTNLSIMDGDQPTVSNQTFIIQHSSLICFKYVPHM